MLCEALRLTGVAGWPDEYFLYWYIRACEPERLQEEQVRDWLLPDAAYVEKFFRAGMTRNGVFGAKVMWTQVELAARNLRNGLREPAHSDHDVFGRVFPNLHYIYITRRNKRAQAVSWAKAVQSGEWFEGGGEKVSALTRLRWKLLSIGVPRRREKRHLAYNFHQIREYYQKIQKQEKAWDAYFQAAGVQPYRVVFEEFAGAYEETAFALLRYLQIPQPASTAFRKRDLKPQSNAINAEWLERFTVELGTDDGPQHHAEL